MEKDFAQDDADQMRVQAQQAQQQIAIQQAQVLANAKLERMVGPQPGHPQQLAPPGQPGPGNGNPAEEPDPQSYSEGGSNGQPPAARVPTREAVTKVDEANGQQAGGMQLPPAGGGSPFGGGKPPQPMTEILFQIIGEDGDGRLVLREVKDASGHNHKGSGPGGGQFMTGGGGGTGGTHKKNKNAVNKNNGREVYHGAASGFEKPKDGSYWTSNKQAAQIYFKDNADGQIHVGHLNPRAKVAELLGESDELVKEYFEKTGTSILNHGHFTDLVESEKFRDFLRSKGFDAISFQEDSAKHNDESAVSHDSIVPLNSQAIEHSHITDKDGNKVTYSPAALDFSHKPKFTNHGPNMNLTVDEPKNSPLADALKNLGA